MREQQYISPIEQYVIDFVRKLRSEKAITQDDVANVLEISRSYIADIESSNRRAKYNLSHVNKLADYFDMSPQDFLPIKPIIDKKGKRKVTNRK